MRKFSPFLSVVVIKKRLPILILILFIMFFSSQIIQSSSSVLSKYREGVQFTVMINSSSGSKLHDGELLDVGDDFDVVVTVRDSVSGAPVVGASVTVRFMDLVREGTTNGSGIYVTDPAFNVPDIGFFNFRKPAKLSITVEKENYTPYSEERTLIVETPLLAVSIVSGVLGGVAALIIAMVMVERKRRKRDLSEAPTKPLLFDT
jgi:hypothetical protein